MISRPQEKRGWWLATITLLMISAAPSAMAFEDVDHVKHVFARVGEVHFGAVFARAERVTQEGKQKRTSVWLRLGPATVLQPKPRAPWALFNNKSVPQAVSLLFTGVRNSKGLADNTVELPLKGKWRICETVTGQIEARPVVGEAAEPRLFVFDSLDQFRNLAQPLAGDVQWSSKNEVRQKLPDKAAVYWLDDVVVRLADKHLAGDRRDCIVHTPARPQECLYLWKGKAAPSLLALPLNTHAGRTQSKAYAAFGRGDFHAAKVSAEEYKRLSSRALRCFPPRGGRGQRLPTTKAGGPLFARSAAGWAAQQNRAPHPVFEMAVRNSYQYVFVGPGGGVPPAKGAKTIQLELGRAEIGPHTSLESGPRFDAVRQLKAFDKDLYYPRQLTLKGAYESQFTFLLVMDPKQPTRFSPFYVLDRKLTGRQTIALLKKAAGERGDWWKNPASRNKYVANLVSQNPVGAAPATPNPMRQELTALVNLFDAENHREAGLGIWLFQQYLNRVEQLKPIGPHAVQWAETEIYRLHPWFDRWRCSAGHEDSPFPLVSPAMLQALKVELVGLNIPTAAHWFAAAQHSRAKAFHQGFREIVRHKERGYDWGVVGGERAARQPVPGKIVIPTGLNASSPRVGVRLILTAFAPSLSKQIAPPQDLQRRATLAAKFDKIDQALWGTADKVNADDQAAWQVVRKQLTKILGEDSFWIAEYQKAMIYGVLKDMNMSPKEFQRKVGKVIGK